MHTADLAFYRADVIGQYPDRPIVVCEGEPATDALATVEDMLEVVAISTMTGASGIPGVDALRPLLGHKVYLWPDNDGPSLRHMERLAALLNTQGCWDILLVDWREAPPKGDADDTVAQSVDVATLLAESRRWRDKADGQGFGGPRLIRLGDVTPETVRWLWRGYVPFGKVTLLAGDPGLGKSWATLDLAARVTVGGETPDRLHRIDKGAVVLLTAEDGLADTVRPRVDVQGGDASLVHVLDAMVDLDGNERPPSLIKDMATLEQVIRSTGARLVIVDPLNAFTGRIDSHVDAQVRQALTPLAKMAERTGAAIVVVMHLNQATLQPALYRVQGSIGYVGAARSVLLVIPDKDNPALLRILAPIKANLAAAMPALGFAITDQPALAWKGVVENVDVASLLAQTGPDKVGSSKLEEAKEFLKEVLGNGPVEIEDVKKEAKEVDIGDSTLLRAKKELGVKALRRNIEGGKRGEGYWTWELVQDDQPPYANNGHLEHQEGNNHNGESEKGEIVQDDQERHVEDGHLEQHGDGVPVDTDTRIGADVQDDHGRHVDDGHLGVERKKVLL